MLSSVKTRRWPGCPHLLPTPRATESVLAGRTIVVGTQEGIYATARALPDKVSARLAYGSRGVLIAGRSSFSAEGCCALQGPQCPVGRCSGCGAGWCRCVTRRCWGTPQARCGSSKHLRTCVCRKAKDVSQHRPALCSWIVHPSTCSPLRPETLENARRVASLPPYLDS